MDKTNISVLTSPVTEDFLPSLPATSPIDTSSLPTRHFPEGLLSVDTLMQEESRRCSIEDDQDFSMQHNTAFDQHMLGDDEDEQDQQRSREQDIENVIPLDLKTTIASLKDDEVQCPTALPPRLRLRSSRKRQRRIQRQIRGPRQTTTPFLTRTAHASKPGDDPHLAEADTDTPAMIAAQTSPTTSRSTTQPLPSIASRRRAMNPALQAHIRHLSLSLCPLVNVSSGQPHPSFPKTMLAYHLLTDAQLDDMANYYHQRTPSPWTRLYPCPVNWAAAVTTADKRRKFGRFIGLKGCDSPTDTGTGTSVTAMPHVPTMEEIQEAARQAVILAEMEAMRQASKGG